MEQKENKMLCYNQIMFSEALCWQARNLFSSPIKAETLLAMERSGAQEQDVGCSALSAPAGIHRSIMSLSLTKAGGPWPPPTRRSADVSLHPKTTDQLFCPSLRSLSSTSSVLPHLHRAGGHARLCSSVQQHHT